jgi:hypothetical protein
MHTPPPSPPERRDELLRLARRVIEHGGPSRPACDEEDCVYCLPRRLAEAVIDHLEGESGPQREPG